MHERVPSSLILVFFDACDGFFTNYNWTEENLEWMKDYSGVGGRQADVYIGVDVFARGKVVGGMLETNKVNTVKSLSVTHETKKSWFNLTAQEIQPLYYHMDLEDHGQVKSSGCPEDAWNGGCSLLLHGLIPATLNTPVCAK
ncbi:hypothetical protein XENOCAPTIV_020148 [Xenoophorus captivus]|uniref:Cytosolic endo-beta-N-acetylglucosaminidase TIM barrel domain-containing protein n=1 Tax=Xenoophorus captivus TaxID=1517983 RepID=A0ABV0RCW8_9TELE